MDTAINAINFIRRISEYGSHVLCLCATPYSFVDILCYCCVLRGIFRVLKWYIRRHMTTSCHEPQVGPEGDIGSEETGELKREIEVLRARLSGLSEATLRISGDLDPGAVLKGTIHSARALTGARYGALLILDPLGGIGDLITSGITSEETEAIKAKPKGLGLLGFLNEIEGPLRLRDLASHPQSIGFPEGHPPMRSFLGTPIFHRGERLGNIYLTEKELGREFTTEDEETITLFASHAAMAISNARRYTEETRAKADLEALVDTSPVGCAGVRREEVIPGVVQPGDAAYHPRDTRAGPQPRGAAQRPELPASGRTGDSPR